MYKTKVIKNIKDLDQRATLIEDMLNEEAKKGWDFQGAISGYKFNVILIFKRNAQHKLNEDINKGISKVKSRVTEIVKGNVSKKEVDKEEN